jgi:aryl-alcohol dehydrogenase-like predicted oxidoreductase
LIGPDVFAVVGVPNMSKLALGTVQFGLAYGVANRAGQVSREEAGQILQLARSAGIDTLDTAIAYGKSEQVLGEQGIDGFKIVTKLPGVPDGIAHLEDWVEDQVVASQRRLGMSSIYALLLHRSEDLLGANGSRLTRALEQLKLRGYAKKIGVSIYDPSELDSVTQVMSLDLVQAPLNLLDRRLEVSGWLRRLDDQGVEIHTRSAFLQGLLLMPCSEIPQKFERWSFLWDTWHSTLADLNTTATAACLSYPLSLPEVDRVVVGVDNMRQLNQIIQASLEGTQEIYQAFTSLRCDDLRLINPSNWSKL